MPTPASHRHDEALSFSSTCPDDQAPHAETNWSQPPLPFEQINRPRREETGVGESGAAGSSQVPSVAIGLALPQSISIMSPGAQPSRETPAGSETNDAIFFDTGEQDDDTKPTDTDLDAVAGDVAGSSSTQDGQSNDANHRSNRRSGAFIRATSLSNADAYVWEPYSVYHGVHRQLWSSGLRVPDVKSPSSMDGDKLEERSFIEHCAWDGISEGYKGFDPTSSRVCHCAWSNCCVTINADNVIRLYQYRPRLIFDQVADSWAPSSLNGKCMMYR